MTVVQTYALPFVFSSRRRHTRWSGDWSSDVCSSDLGKLEMRAAALPAPWHLVVGLLRARGLSWRECRAALRLLSWLKRRRFRLERDMPVSNLLLATDQSYTLRERIWEPLCVAAMNTPAHEASGQIFANVLRDSLAADAHASDMLLPRVDLSELFPVPATRYLGQRRSQVRTATTIEAIVQEEDGFSLKGDWSLDHYSHVVVATAPYHAASLLGTTTRCDRLVELIGALDYEPIVTVYLAYPPGVGLPGPLIGLPDAPGQWAFDRGQIVGPHEDYNLLSVVISTHGPHDDIEKESLIVAIHAQLERLLHRRLPRSEEHTSELQSPLNL